MARIDLANLGQKAADKHAGSPTAATEAPAAPKAAKPAKTAPRRQSRTQSAPQRAQRPTSTEASPAGERLRYDELERKEARLRADQYERLNEISRGLNRARKGTGERITENTLIRVAIDLLTERADELQGITEAELRRSVGL